MSSHKRVLRLLSLVALSASVASAMASGSDWPTWRHDANRSGASSLELPSELHLQWKRELPAPRPAFPEDVRLCFDISYEPVVMDKRMFLPSMVTDSVTALHADTGEEEWTFFAEGPVRFAPVVWQGNVYAASDDGCVYCLSAKDGKQVWKFRAAPEADRIFGNEQVASRWPLRSGLVVDNGTVYVIAGMWPMEGVYL